MLKLGTQNISGMYVGEQKIKKAFVGAELVFEDNPTYTVYFYAIEGTDTSKILNSSSWTVTPGESVTVYPWTIDGYIFEGWYEGDTLLSSETGAFVYTPEKPVTTIYLRYAVTYNLTINVGSDIVGVSVLLNGANVPNPQLSRTYTFKPGTQITLEGKDFPTGWQFSHWYNDFTSFSYTNPWTFTMPSKNVGISLEGKKASRLPAGYTELEYIEAGSASSNICFKGDSLNTNTGSTFNIKVYIPSITNSTFSKDVLLGNSSTSSAYRLNLKIFSGKWNADFHYGKLSYTELTGFPISGLLEFKVTYADKKISLNTSYSKALSSVSGFSAGANGFTVNSTHATGFRFYGMSCSSTTSTSANYNWEIVPCKNASGTIGYYILGKGKFYSKVTSAYTAGLYGTWTAGPAV